MVPHTSTPPLGGWFRALDSPSMAYLQTHCFSKALGMNVSFDVILPENTGTTMIGMEGSEKVDLAPTLYLLHGLSDDHSIWMRRTSIERYVAPLGIAVVMPNVHRSFYANFKDGPAYFDFVAEELPELCRGFFHLSDRREDNHLAGLSMGGYGAFKIALRHPERFASAASLSGALDRDFDTLRDDQRREVEGIFAHLGSFSGSDNDLLHLVDECGDTKPRLWQWCGTEDFLYGDNQRFKDHIAGKGFDHTYLEGPGDHSWGHWDENIQVALEWMFAPPSQEDTPAQQS